MLDDRNERDKLLDILANVRSVLLPLVDYKDNQRGDMLACTVSNPDCIECLAKQIAKQYEGLKGEVERLKEKNEAENEALRITCKERNDIRQQVERYRQALEDINTHVGDITSTQFYHDAYVDVKQIASKARERIYWTPKAMRVWIRYGLRYAKYFGRLDGRAAKRRRRKRGWLKITKWKA